MKLSGRPGPLLRRLFKLPLLVDALGLLGVERLLGFHWLVVTVTGRKSGQPRRVVLDLLMEREDGFYADSGWIESQWVKNLRSDPRVSFSIDRRQFRGVAEELSPEAGAEIYLAWVARRRWAGRAVLRALSIDFSTPEATRRGLIARATVWAFRSQRIEHGSPNDS